MKYTLEEYKSMWFNPGFVKNLLDGDINALNRAFIWNLTREGYSFWYTIFLQGLKDKQMQILKEMCIEFEELSHDRMAKWEIEVKDNVNNPSHYGQGKIECIEYIKDFLNEDEYIGYLRGNIAKYLHRWRYKNGLEDLKKSQWYLNELIKVVGNDNPSLPTL